MEIVGFDSVYADNGNAKTETVIPTNQYWNVYQCAISSSSSNPGNAVLKLNGYVVAISYSGNSDYAEGTPLTKLNPGSKLTLEWSNLDVGQNVICNASLLVERILR